MDCDTGTYCPACNGKLQDICTGVIGANQPQQQVAGNGPLYKYGADAIRLYMLNSPAVRGEDLRFSEKGLIETTRQQLLPLWNALSFFTTYAKIDGWEPNKENLSIKKNNPLDVWIISRLQKLIEEVKNEMDNYDLNRSVAPFVGFIDSK